MINLINKFVILEKLLKIITMILKINFQKKNNRAETGSTLFQNNNRIFSQKN